MIFLVLRVTFNFIVLLFYEAEHELKNKILQNIYSTYSLYLLVFVLILSLPSACWYIDNFNRSYIPYLGFLSRSSTKSDIIY